jgi:hypothetical protein
MENTSKKQKKEFFLTKWIKSLLNWLDTKLFTSATAEAIKPSFLPMLWSLGLSFLGGIIVGLHSLFAENTDTFTTIVFGIIIALILGICVWYLILDLKRFPQIGIKIGRSAYILFLAGLSLVVGFYLAVIVLMIAIFALVLWVLWIAVFDKDKNKKSFTLSNGDEVTVEHGLCGEKYYTGQSGKEYETTNGETFTEKEY